MTYTEIENRIYFLADTDNTAIPDADLSSMVGRAQEHITSLILTSDLRWRWDDSNKTDLPIATAALVAEQQDYSISAAATQLIIERIEVKDASGNWTLLRPFDQSRLKGDYAIAMTEYRETSGDPLEYDLVGNSVFLYPKPNYSQAASLKIHYARGPLLFDYSDDKFTDDTGSATSTPGFNVLFHDLIPLLVTYEYVLAKRNNPARAQYLLVQIQNKTKALQDFYAMRQNDVRPRFTVNPENTGLGSISGRISG